jgi:hypothetical protein
MRVQLEPTPVHDVQNDAGPPEGSDRTATSIRSSLPTCRTMLDRQRVQTERPSNAISRCRLCRTMLDRQGVQTSTHDPRFRRLRPVQNDAGPPEGSDGRRSNASLRSFGRVQTRPGLNPHRLAAASTDTPAGIGEFAAPVHVPAATYVLESTVKGFLKFGTSAPVGPK